MRARVILALLLLPAICSAQYIGNKRTRADSIRSFADVGSMPVSFVDTTLMLKPILMDSTAQLTSIPFATKGAKGGIVYRGELGLFLVTPTRTVKLDSTWSGADSAVFATRSYVILNYQPLDGDLTAIAALSGTNTIYYRSASNTWTAVTIGSPVTFSGGTLTVQDAAADGSTKGAASFTATDFNSSSGNISIDYTNGQAASGSQKGFLSSADWTTFNNKQAAGSYLTAVDSANYFLSKYAASTLYLPIGQRAKFSVTGSAATNDSLRLTAGSGVTLTPSGNVITITASGGSPGGSTTQVQFNDAGSFGGDADWVWNKTTNKMGIVGDIGFGVGDYYLSAGQSSESTDPTLSFSAYSASTRTDLIKAQSSLSTATLNFPQTTASTLFGGDASKNLQSVSVSSPLSLSGATLSLPADGVTNAYLNNMAANTIKTNATASSDNPTDVALAANQFLARSSSGNIAAKSVTDAALSILDDATVGDMRTTMGIGTGNTPTFNGLTLTSDISMGSHFIDVGSVNLLGTGGVLNFTLDGQYAYGTTGAGDSYGFAAQDDGIADRALVLEIVNSSAASSDEYVNFPKGIKVGGVANPGKVLVGNNTSMVLAKRDTSTYLTANATTTSTSLVFVSGLTCYMAANEIWHFEADLKVGSSSAAGTKYGVNIPTSASMYVNITGTTSAAGTETEEQVTADATAAATAFNTAGLTTAAVGAFVHIEGVIINGANAGNFEIMHLKVTSGTSTIYAGSRLTAWRTN